MIENAPQQPERDLSLIELKNMLEEGRVDEALFLVRHRSENLKRIIADTIAAAEDTSRTIPEQNWRAEQAALERELVELNEFVKQYSNKDSTDS